MISGLVTVAMPLTPGSTTVQNKFLLPQVAFITEIRKVTNTMDLLNVNALKNICHAKLSLHTWLPCHAQKRLQAATICIMVTVIPGLLLMPR